MTAVQPARKSLYKQFRTLVWKILDATSPALRDLAARRFSKTCSENWTYRTKVVRASPDNAFIPRVPDAGKIHGDVQIMHNGIKVLVGSYYGGGSSRLLRANRGVHEPQEERAFQEVLKVIPPGSVMIELGAYWAFYSLWFCEEVQSARAYMVEPMEENLVMGRKNFELNGRTGSFTRALVGAAPGTVDGVRMLCVDEFLAEQKLDRVAILHSDIQGFEVDMLKGAEQSLRAGRISFLFISTHNDELHATCEDFLRQRGLITLASVRPSESYSVDGVIVCRSPFAPEVPPLQFSKRPPDAD